MSGHRHARGLGGTIVTTRGCPRFAPVLFDSAAVRPLSLGSLIVFFLGGVASSLRVSLLAVRGVPRRLFVALYVLP